jgi:CoA:oxalate CoA-transferase
MSALFLVCNRGKAVGSCLDLHQAEGAAIALRLASESDVVIENFRPGVMDKASVSTGPLNPDVVYAPLASPGPVPGPRRATPPVIQAYGGRGPATRADPETGVPVFLRQTAADKVTALDACQAITAALARANGARRAAPRVSMAGDGWCCLPLGRLRR